MSRTPIDYTIPQVQRPVMLLYLLRVSVESGGSFICGFDKTGDVLHRFLSSADEEARERF